MTIMEKNRMKIRLSIELAVHSLSGKHLAMLPIQKTMFPVLELRQHSEMSFAAKCGNVSGF